jgi:hypothetical protein
MLQDQVVIGFAHVRPLVVRVVQVSPFTLRLHPIIVEGSSVTMAHLLKGRRPACGKRWKRAETRRQGIAMANNQ